LQANAAAAIGTAFGGQAIVLTTRTGQSFYVLASTGTVQAYRMSGGRFGLIVSGTTLDTELTINPLVIRKTKNSAHTFRGELSGQTGLINIGSINVTNGLIGSVLGYRTAILSGPLFATGTSALGPSRLAGLFGELVVLERLLERRGDAANLWTGPSGHRHDFTGVTRSVEVKTSTATEGRRVRIHGLDQLEAPSGAGLDLVWVRVEQNASGRSVPALVEDLWRWRTTSTTC